MQGPLQWLSLFNDPIDIVGFLLFLLVFPVYHGIYPWLSRWMPGHASKPRVDMRRIVGRRERFSPSWSRRYSLRSMVLTGDRHRSVQGSVQDLFRIRSGLGREGAAELSIGSVP